MDKRKNNTKLIISWVLLLSLVITVVFQFSTSQTNAQQANSNRVGVTCAPTKPEIIIGEQVTFVAAVVNAPSTVRFSWNGPVCVNAVNGNEIYAFHTGGANTLFSDGRVVFLTTKLNIVTLCQLISFNDGQVVGDY